MGKKIVIIALSIISIFSCSKTMTTTQIRENSIRINALEISRLTLEELKEKYPDIVVTQPTVDVVEIKVPEIALNFDFDKSNVKPQYYQILRDFVTFINTNDYVLTLEGHTDSKGSDEYNDKLSLRRSESVKAKMLEFGLEPSRVEKIVGKGEKYPIATNDTDEGRSQNRRMMFILRKK